MKKILIISHCNECHHFDDEYYTYNEKCSILNRIIKADNNLQYPIPEDCPLDTYKEEEEDL